MRFLPLASVALALTTLSPFAAPHSTLAAQQSPDSIRDDRAFSFWARGPYRPAVPRPDRLLGYEIGEMNTQFGAQERVLLAIADAAKDRVRIEPIGTTVERRPMRLFIVSSPENIARLDAIRADLDRIADPRGASAGDLAAIAARTPAVVWINESIHGNESPGFENAMPLLYQLAASDEPATVEMLKHTIVIINPSMNPDGHERFAVWYNSINVKNPDPGAYEHREPWSIQGRYNHYRFDMNRDVIATTQREVQAVVKGMLRWHPMVTVDQHGQVGTYFFPPAARPVNENLGPNATKWLEAIGQGNAAAFDAHGWMYFSRDQFDLYYPGYWDTWPSLTGATGMTYETDGGGWKGIAYRRDDGSIVSFRDGIAKHFTSALATIQTTAGRSTERVRDYLAFRQDASSSGSGGMRRVVLLPGRDPARAAELAGTLLRAGIEVRRTTAAFSSARAHGYDGATGQRRFDAGAYVIDLAQPQGHVARAILEPASQLDTIFARTQTEKAARNARRGKRAEGEGYEFYDITAWSLPTAFGVDAAWTEDAGAVSGALLALPDDSSGTARRVAGELLPVDVGGGVVGGQRATSAYVFTSERNGALRLAYHLLAEGFTVSVATQPLDAGGRTWPRGTYVVRPARNVDALYARLDALARESGVDVTPINSAFTGNGGQFGLGSDPVVGLRAPKVAVVSDEGISQTSYGALWFDFERRYGITFTPVSLGYLSGGDIAQFNVIIVPDGSAGAIGGKLGKGGAERLKTWVEGGGTLITMAGASAWAASEGANLTTARALGADDAPKADSAAKGKGADSVGNAARRRERASDKTQDDLLAVTSPTAANGPQPVPGANFDVVLDRTHWLTFGYETPRITVLFEGDVFLKLSREGTNVGVFPATGPLVRAGFTFPGNTERLLRNTAFLVEEPVGDGHVVLFANDPMFRGWWRALDRLVLNGIVLGPSF